jgi:hypothetical protein
MICPSSTYPEPLYAYRAPGSKLSGAAFSASRISWSVNSRRRFIDDRVGTGGYQGKSKKWSLIPEVCVSRWRTVMDFQASGSGPRYRSMGSSRRSLPSSSSSRTAAAVKDLVIEAMANFVCARTGTLSSTSARP